MMNSLSKTDDFIKKIYAGFRFVGGHKPAPGSRLAARGRDP